MDDDMNTLCEIIGKRKDKKKINELGYLSTINDTMQSSDQIKQEDRLSVNIRARLLTFIKWKEDNETGTLDEFEEYLENNEGKKCYDEIKAILSNPTTKTPEEPQMDGDMLHILNEIGFTNADRSRLEEGGILTVANLRDNESQLREKKCCGLMNDIQERLLIVIKWFDNNPSASPKSFSTKELEDTDKELKRRERMVNTYVNMLGEYNPAGSNKNHRQDICKAMDNDPTLFEEAIQEFKSRVLSETASNLKEGVKYFEVDKYLRHIVTILHKHLRDPVPVRERKGSLVLMYGGAQAGKTGAEALNLAIAAVLGGMRRDDENNVDRAGIPMFLTTKGNRECKDKVNKLKKLSKGTSLRASEIVVAPNSKSSEAEKKEKRKQVECNLVGGRGINIFADSIPQTDLMIDYTKEYHNHHPNGHSIMSVDEVDEFVRSEEGYQGFEKKLQELSRVLRPTIVVLITASPVAVYKHIENVKERFNCEGQEMIFQLNPGEDYIKSADIKHYLTFLVKGECEKKEPYKTEGLTIPYSSESQIAFIKASLKPRSLILDCTCPYVNVEEANVFVKAARTQELIVKSKQLTVPVVIVVTGESSFGLSVKFPNAEWDKKTWKDECFGTLLEHIDEKHLETPVMLFGNYSSMGRCFSFRSIRRVPTAMILYLGLNHSMQTLEQLAGRVLGYNKSVLEENGFDSPILLTTEEDFKTIQTYAKNIKRTIERMKQGDTLEQAMHGTNEPIPHELAFFAKTDRKLGKLKGQREQMVAVANITPMKKKKKEEEEVHADAVGVGDVQNDSTATITIHTKKVIQSLKLLLLKDRPEQHEDSIFQDLCVSQVHESYVISPEELKNELDQLCKMSLLVKSSVEKGKQWYKINSNIEDFHIDDMTALNGNRKRTLESVVGPEKKSKGGL